MLPITGYANRLSVQPGETIEFKVSCETPGSYDAHLVKIRCADVNAESARVQDAARLDGGDHQRGPQDPPWDAQADGSRYR